MNNANNKMKKFDEIDFNNLSQEEMRALPDGYISTFTSRPTERGIEQARKFMYFRATLIVLASLYALIFDHINDKQGYLLVIFLYEVFYYDLTHKSLTKEYYDELDKYNAKVAELDLKYYYSGVNS